MTQEQSLLPSEELAEAIYLEFYVKPSISFTREGDDVVVAFTFEDLRNPKSYDPRHFRTYNDSPGDYLMSADPYIERFNTSLPQTTLKWTTLGSVRHVKTVLRNKLSELENFVNDYNVSFKKFSDQADQHAPKKPCIVM
jgi:hypothetical protein